MRPTPSFTWLHPLLLGLLTATSASTEGANLALEDLVKRLEPSIVSIVVTPDQTPGESDASGTGVQPGRTTSPKGAMIGSGTLVSSDGLVLTDCSLFEHSGEILVGTDGGQSHRGAVIGLDKRSCLALLRIPVTGHAFVKVAPVAGLAPGERVLGLGRKVIGGESHVSVTDGVLSTIYGAAGVESMIESSMVLLPGLGGGPMIRQRTGELIGINGSQYVSRSGQVLSTFGIPISMYLRIEDALRTKGRVPRFTIGIAAAPLKFEDARGLGVPDEKGVLITSVAEGSVAKRGGLTAGDIVVEADGIRVAQVTDLFTVIAERPAGAPLRLKYFRRGEVRDLTLTPVPRVEN